MRLYTSATFDQVLLKTKPGGSAHFFSCFKPQVGPLRVQSGLLGFDKFMLREVKACSSACPLTEHACPCRMVRQLPAAFRRKTTSIRAWGDSSWHMWWIAASSELYVQVPVPEEGYSSSMSHCWLGVSSISGITTTCSRSYVLPPEETSRTRYWVEEPSLMGFTATISCLDSKVVTRME